MAFSLRNLVMASSSSLPLVVVDLLGPSLVVPATDSPSRAVCSSSRTFSTALVCEAAREGA